MRAAHPSWAVRFTFEGSRMKESRIAVLERRLQHAKTDQERRRIAAQLREATRERELPKGVETR